MKTKLFLLLFTLQSFYSLGFTIGGVTYTIVSPSNVLISDYKCSIINVELPNTVTYDSNTYNVVFLVGHAFASCTVLESDSLYNSNIAINNFWNINIQNGLPLSKILIFDRYGKLINESYFNKIEWDGAYQNNRFNLTDYRLNINYVYKLEISKQYKSHFTLKR